MTQEISDILTQHNLIFKKTKSLSLFSYTNKKKYQCYLAEDLKNKIYLIFFNFAKSKILLKEVEDLEKTIILLQQNSDICSNKILYFYQSKICSKAKNYLETKGIKGYAFM